MSAATMPTKLAAEMLAAARRLSQEVDALRFAPPVTHVYNPLAYAWEAQAQYIERHAGTRKRVVLLGMNPGPFGMGQTGVPFGEVARVRGFLGIEATVSKPAVEHPARPVQGFACTRSEVSGARVWGLVESRWGTAQAFFADHYVANYCPLLFMEASGKNRTPDKLPGAERAALTAACDRHLRRTIELLEPTWVIGIGGYAEQQARTALGDRVKIGRILHPSPASPAANLGWAEAAVAELRALGIPVPDPKDRSETAGAGPTAPKPARARAPRQTRVASGTRVLGQ
jgi:single-strand selective monofunctional uracil DNA glycosylase